jgi:hypothetical protein
MNNKELDINQELEQMRQDYAALKDRCDKQQIVNDQILRKAMKQSGGRLRFNSNLSIALGVVAVLFAFFIPQLGLSKPFFFFTLAMMLVAIAAAVLASMHLPKLDGDLVTAATETVRFRKIYTTWPKIGLPIAAVWFGLFIREALKNHVAEASDIYLFVASMVVFALLGVLFGFKHRHNLLDATDDLLSQIDQLRKGGI